ncbi:MAG: hypothetical protein ACM3UU_02975 [Ignavibacteriales bacterium]
MAKNREFIKIELRNNDDKNEWKKFLANHKNASQEIRNFIVRENKKHSQKNDVLPPTLSEKVEEEYPTEFENWYVFNGATIKAKYPELTKEMIYTEWLKNKVDK